MPARKRDLGAGGWGHPDTWIRLADLLDAGRHADDVVPIWARLERIHEHLDTSVSELAEGARELAKLDEELLYSRRFYTHVGSERRAAEQALQQARVALEGLRWPLSTWRELYDLGLSRRQCIMVVILARPLKASDVTTFRPWDLNDIARLCYRRGRPRAAERSHWRKHIKRILDRQG